jgi:bifunctional DNA-binding transcriptional regulator/antitoxin component of YhaV-PrlF toxin-antitoxin module
LYHLFIQTFGGRGLAVKVADEVWTSVALLHKENPERADFAVEEIKARARRENWPIRPGFNVHASYHCLANKPANPANHRMLYEDSRGRKRLYRPGDPCHSERQNGKVHPDKLDLLPAYQSLVDWYDKVYSKQSAYPSSPASRSGKSELHQFPLDAAAAFVGFEEMRSATVFVGPGGTVALPEYLRQELGLKEGSCLSVYRDKDCVVLMPITDQFIRGVRGSCKGEYSLIEDREREHWIEKER